MNINTLKVLEAKFLAVYPKGFDHPDLVKIGKKHKMPQMITLAQELFRKDNFKNPDIVVENMIKLVSRSSMVSVFEKPKFRDFARSLNDDRKAMLSHGLFELLHGKEEIGFSMILDILDDAKLAKWTLISVYPAYFTPQKGVFIKPTTVKNTIAQLELTGLQYQPKPTFSFYKKYRAAINKMKKEVDPSFRSSNAAFSGFLMMSMAL